MSRGEPQRPLGIARCNGGSAELGNGQDREWAGSGMGQALHKKGIGVGLGNASPGLAAHGRPGGTGTGPFPACAAGPPSLPTKRRGEPRPPTPGKAAAPVGVSPAAHIHALQAIPASRLPAPRPRSYLRPEGLGNELRPADRLARHVGPAARLEPAGRAPGRRARAVTDRRLGQSDSGGGGPEGPTP